MTVQSCPIPKESALARYAAEADFADAYHTANPLPASSALQIWLETVKKTPRWIALAMRLSTAVKTQNLLGRLYMLPVKPMHRRIVPAVLSRI